MTRAPSTLILCDFDGTISVKDTVNRLIQDHVVSPEWRYHVKRYLRGEIGSKGVYQAIAPLMHMTTADLDRFVDDHAELDPAFPAFLQWAQTAGIDVKIVSDGFDATINTLFRNHDIAGLDIFTNALAFDADGRVTIETPFANPSCGICGTCKREVIRRFRNQYDRIILIGDGESDRHAAHEADMVLALEDLFVYCARNHIPALRVVRFEEAPHLLRRHIEAVAFDLDGTLLDSLDCITDSFNHLFRELGLPTLTRDEVVRQTSVSLNDYLRDLLGESRVEQAKEIFRSYYDTVYLHQTHLMPGALEALANLPAGVARGAITNKRGRYARRIADHLGLTGYLTTIIGAEDGHAAKPSAAMFEEFMARTGSDRAHTIYVGDTPLDVQAARNAGIDTYAIAGPTHTPEQLALCGARRVLTSIAELPASMLPLV